jgi:thioredoxin-like negative regulator of GroEL
LLAALSVAPALAQTSSYTVRAGGVIVDRPPRPEVIADLGTARRLAQANDYQAALPMYLMLAASDPSDAEMSIELARVLGFADRNGESAAVYRRVIAQAPQRRRSGSRAALLRRRQRQCVRRNPQQPQQQQRG